MQRFQGFLYDLDGVVIDSEFARDDVTRELIASHGGVYDRDKLKPLMSGKPEREIMQIILDEYKIKASIDELLAIKREKVKTIYRDSVKFVPGFMDFYRRLNKKFNLPTAIATSLDSDYFKLVDKRLGISDLFDGHVYNSGMVKNSKPAPDVFIYAAEKIGARADRCVVFEDAPNGIAAALRAGAETIGLARTFSKEILLQSSSMIIERDLAEGEKLLIIPDYSEESFSRVLEHLS